MLEIEDPRAIAVTLKVSRAPISVECLVSKTLVQKGGAPCPGRAVQIDPIKPTLKASGTERLKLESGGTLSNVASEFKVRRYIPVPRVHHQEIVDAAINGKDYTCRP